MVRVELCITRSGFYVADTVPDLRAIESRTEVAASQINRRGGARAVRRVERGKKEKRSTSQETRREETQRGTEEDGAMPAGDEDAFHSAESERRAR